MKTISVKRDAYKKLVKFYKQHVGDRRSAEWDAIFSCNPDKEAWPRHDYGYSHADDREYVHKRSKLLRKLVRIALADRPDGGRFFINKRGVFVKPEGEEIRQIASFNW